MAVCHEWLVHRYGSEKTFEAMAKALPSADLYALTVDPDAPFSFGGRELSTTFLDRLGALRDRRDVQLPLMPLAWRYSSRRRYDLVVTSSHACAKGFWPAREALHLCYCYTPLRYVWMPSVDERRRRGTVSRVVESRLRSWDLRSLRWVDEFAAISGTVADRIDRFYGRKARVIYPPVETDFFTPAATERDGVLAVARMVSYKRLDLAIRACHRSGRKLTVAGAGPDESRLRALADDLDADVRFVIRPDDSTLRQLYRSARVVVFAAEEDFGIVTVEAQACGTPVVALGRGGSAETVEDGRTGALVAEQDVELFAAAIDRVDDGDLDPAACRANAERFSAHRFAEEFTGWLEQALTARGMDAASLLS